MFEALAKALEIGLQLWLNKEKTQYVDKLVSLRSQWHAEYNKPDDVRSDAVLDNLEFELRQLAFAFASSVAQPDTGTQH
jgi:hypothetical protein